MIPIEYDSKKNNSIFPLCKKFTPYIIYLPTYTYKNTLSITVLRNLLITIIYIYICEQQLV